MQERIVSIKDKENIFFLSIKNEIEAMVDTKLHSLYQNQSALGVDIKKIEEESKNQFFEELAKQIENSIRICREFYERLREDDLILHQKLEKEIGQISEKIAGIQSIRELMELNKGSIAKEDQKKIYTIGVKYFQGEAFDIAYLYFSFLSLVDAENPQFWLARGMVEQNLGQYQDALSSYSSSISLAPSNLIVYIQMMDTMLLMKHFEEAHHVYDIFMKEIDPEHYIHDEFIVSKLETVRSFLTHAVS